MRLCISFEIFARCWPKTAAKELEFDPHGTQFPYLLARGVLRKLEGGGRSTGYELCAK
jgi:hypothetical protein